MPIKKIGRVLADVASLRLVSQELRGLREQVDSIRDQVVRASRAAAEGEYSRIAAECRGIDRNRLEFCGGKRLSQNDEDGIISEIFRRIGTKSRRFVEFGTGDGTENNTVSLLIDGWSGLWIDGCTEAHRHQMQVFRRWIESGNLSCLQSFLRVDNIDSVISSAGVCGEIDLLSIDVDGNDLALWKAVRCVQPRVVVIEYNAYLAPPVRWSLPYDPSFHWDGRSAVFGASLQAMADYGAECGFELVGCNISGLNAFFVRADECGRKFPFAKRAVDLYHPRRYWLDVMFSRPSAELLTAAIDGISVRNPSDEIAPDTHQP